VGEEPTGAEGSRGNKKKVEWQDIERSAFEKGLTVSEFHSMSPRQFQNYCDAWVRRRSMEFEHTRAICYYMVAVNRDPKKALPTMEKFWPLPTDDKKHEDISKDRAAEIRRKYAMAAEIAARHNMINDGGTIV
jgi:hypothetical protein